MWFIFLKERRIILRNRNNTSFGTARLTPPISIREPFSGGMSALYKKEKVNKGALLDTIRLINRHWKKEMIEYR